MKTFTYVIKDPVGIHARPAGIIVAEAKKYTADIKITNKGKTADLKRIFNVMGLCVKSGEEIKIDFNGSDEDVAYSAIKKLFEDNL